MSRNAQARLRRRVIGYVFQDFNLLPALTAAEKVSLPLESDGRPLVRRVSPGMRMSIETRNNIPPPTQIIDTATIFGIVLALGIVAMSVGPVRGEAARGLRTLAATGVSATHAPHHHGGDRDRARVHRRRDRAATSPGSPECSRREKWWQMMVGAGLRTVCSRLCSPGAGRRTGRA